jgi:hypothetical protein
MQLPLGESPKLAEQHRNSSEVAAALPTAAAASAVVRV